MINEKILLIITNELTGQESGEEKDILKDWLSESRDNACLYHSYKEAFINGKYELKAKNNNEAYKKLSERLGFNDTKSISINDNKLKSLWQNSISNGWVRKIAATILILVTSALIIYQSRYYWKPSQKTVLSNELIVKSNPRGLKTLITLPDGSKVKLNSESHIEYYSNFEKSRMVNLIGEAFFNVVKDTLSPFYVKTGDLSVRVLGTSFNVEAFPFEDKIKVALVTGKVMIEKKEGIETRFLEYLDPDEMLVYDHKTSEFNKSTYDYTETLGWKDGKLIFREANINEVVKKLERWYGVEINVDRGADIVGGFNGIYKDAPLEVVLEGMGFTSEFEYEIRGEKVFIK